MALIRNFVFIVIGMSLSVSAQTSGAKIISLELDRDEIVLPCRPGLRSDVGKCNDDPDVKFVVRISGADPANVTFRHIVSGGRIVSLRPALIWSVAGVPPGVYTLTVEIAPRDSKSDRDIFDTKTVILTVKECNCHYADSCPSISIESPETVEIGKNILVKANVIPEASTYEWTVSAGNIVTGQGSPSITVSPEGLPSGSNVTVTVFVPDDRGFCQTSASRTTAIVEPPKPVLVDEIGRSGLGELRARLDTFFTQLSNYPDNSGVLIIYAPNNSDYNTVNKTIRNHISTRKFEASRISILRGPKQRTRKVRFYSVPPGAGTPTP